MHFFSLFELADYSRYAKTRGDGEGPSKGAGTIVEVPTNVYWHSHTNFAIVD